MTHLDDLVPLSYWVDAEMFGAIIFASLPALRQLFTHYKQYHTLRRVEDSTNPSRHPSTKDSFSSSYRTRKFLGSSSTAARTRIADAQPPASEGIARRTDVYIELDDVEASNERWRGPEVWSIKQEPSRDSVRGHAS